MSVNSTSVSPVAPLGTAIVLAAGTAAATFAAATTAATATAVAYGVLAVTLAGVSIASITAWFDRESVDVGSYFSNVVKHSGYAIAGIYQFVAQTLVQALVQGLANGISRNVSRRIGGDDVTVSVRHS
jgi:hypothetical protein